MFNTSSGIKFAVDRLGIDYSNVFTAFSFSSEFDTNSNILNSDSWTIESCSGILNKTTPFYNYSGTGYFDGNTFIELNKDYQLNNSTILMSYEKLRAGNEILLSSVNGDSFNSYSGFYVGVNDANKLYLKYWNNVEGVFTLIYHKTLSNKNLIIIDRSSSNIKLGHFNNNTFEFETENFLIFQDNFINSNNLYVGGSPNIINWGGENLLNFSGYLDKFYIFNEIPFIYVNSLAQGLYSAPTGYAGEFIENCYVSGFLSGSGFSYTGVTGTVNSGFLSGIVGVTGYANILSGYSYSGITGSVRNNIGSYIDNCGNNIDIFETILLSGLIYEEVPIRTALTGLTFVNGSVSLNLTGTVTGIQNVYVTGAICESVFNVTGDVAYEYNQDYLSSLSYKEISLLSVIEPNQNIDDDILEIYTEIYKNATLDYNKNLIFDNISQNYFYIDTEFKPNDILLFANGQAIIDSGYQLIPSGYEIIRRPNLDYFITGITIETNKFFEAKDFLFYDYFTGKFWATRNSGSLVNFPDDFNAPYFVYKNGQKLIENKDYSTIQNLPISIDLINVSNDEINYIIVKEISPLTLRVTGKYGTLKLSSNFNHDCSQVYYNGIKQKNYNNYIENSNFDLISGIFYESQNSKNLIYNNTDDFFV